VSLSRKGAGLLELVIALTLTGLLTALVWSILVASAFRLRDRSERMAGEHALRVLAGATRAALESLGRDSSGGTDLVSIGPRSLVSRALRAAGVLCAASPDQILVRQGAGWWSALRDPVPGRDSLLVAAIVGSPRWLALALQAPPRPAACPDGTAGLALPVTLDPTALDAIGPGSPMRVVEDVELRLYSSSGQWLGLRAVATGEAIQPLAGPLATQGLEVIYLARWGAPTVDPAEVSAVVLRLDGLTERAGGLGLAHGVVVRPDSVTVFVAIENP